MSLLDSVYLLLQESASPMRPKELAAALIQWGMWQSQGKTPDATVGARIYEDIKKHGNQSRFIKAAEGLFALNPNVKIELSDSGEKAGKAVKRKQPEKSAGSYSFSDCAEKVLLHFSGNAPMHYRDITSKALEFGVAQDGRADSRGQHVRANPDRNPEEGEARENPALRKVGQWNGWADHLEINRFGTSH